MKCIVALDIDGVLIDPRGYYQALKGTVSHFSRAMGIGDQAPADGDIQAFEAHGLSSEWDMGAACVTLLLVDRLAQSPEPGLPAEWDDALAYLGARPVRIARPDYAGVAASAGRHLQQGLGPPRAIRAALQERIEACPLPAALPALLEQLLRDLHSFDAAPVTRVFQHLAIGSARIRETYGVEAELESAPVLEAHDRVLLRHDVRRTLLQRWREGLGLVLCTLRPSGLPEGSPHLRGFSREAEMARHMVGLDGVPLVGRGHVLWLARQVGEPLEALVKPYPVQALAAMAQASGGTPTNALQSAHRLYRSRICDGLLRSLEGAEVCIVEDTSNGLRAFCAAVELLYEAGIDTGLKLLGVSGRSQAKASALGAAGAEVFADVNEALLSVLA